MNGMLGVKPPEWTEADWLAWRRQGIGGSDVAALCGFSRFASPVSVFYDKIGEAAPLEPTKPMIWGQKHEPLLAEAFEEETGLHVLHPQTLAVDPSHPWRRCTLDGLVAESPDLSLLARDAFLGLCEIKCSSDYGWDEFPDEYAVQIQWQMGVAGFERCWVPVLHQGNNDRIYGPFDFDPPAFDALCSIVDRFFHDHVKTQSPPRPDGSDATTAALRAAFPKSDGDPIELPDDVLDIARALVPAKQREKDAKAEVQRIQNTIGAALGRSGAGGIRRDDGEIVPVVTWKTQPDNRVDLDALRLDAPELVEKHTKVGTKRVMRQTKVLAELIGATQGANA